MSGFKHRLYRLQSPNLEIGIIKVSLLQNLQIKPKHKLGLMAQKELKELFTPNVACYIREINYGFKENKPYKSNT